jgi:ubiquitin-conjugating enzyme E2 S
MFEIRELARNPSEGVEYVETETSNISEIHAMIAGPEETPFYGGKFRLKLVLSDDYPNSPPKGYFLTKIYHPNVANNGDICVNTLKKDWTPNVTLKHVFEVIRCLLIVPFPESSLNDEAGKMFMDSYEEFAARAKIMTQVHAIVDKKCCSGTKQLGNTEESQNINNKVAVKQNKDKETKKKNFKRL